MAMTLEELVSKWTIDADLSPLEEGRKGLEGLAVSFAAIAASVGAAAAGLFGIAKATANAGEEAKIAALKFGITAKAYQELQYAARGEADELSGGLLFLNKNMENAASGGKEAAKAFSRLGVSLFADGKIRNSDDVLMDIAESFKTMPADARRTAAAVDIFGRSGANLIPFLVQGKDAISELRQEAVDFGYVIEDTEAADAFNDAMDDLVNIMKGFRNTVGAALIPVITDLMGSMKEWLRINRDWLRQSINDYLKLTVHYITIMGGFVIRLARALNTLVKLFGGWKVAIWAAVIAMGTLLAATTILSLGRIAFGVVEVVRQLQYFAAAWRFVGNAAIFAQLKMLAIPLAIGAAIVAVLLAIEDLYTYFSGGGDTITGDFVDLFKQMGTYIAEVFMSLMNSTLTYIQGLVAPLRDWIMSMLQPVIDAMNWVIAQREKISFKGVQGAISSVNNGVMSMLGMGPKASAGAPANAGQMLGMTPSAGAVMGGPSNNANVNQNTVVNQTIQVGENASPLETGKVVGSHTDNALNRRNREAARTFSAQPEY